jgi:omega-6 fatty acid desaturase (delta-12 desaturase)
MSFTAEEVLTYAHRSMVKGVAVFLVDAAILITFVYIALAASPWWLQAFFSLATGIMIGILFVVGHDAGHNALTPSRMLNRVLGQLALLPALHPFSLWVNVHNHTHHRWTNLSPRDYVWTPLSLEAYRALLPIQQWLYKVYRGPLGPVFYYIYEFWWGKIFFPRRRELRRLRWEHFLDTAVVVAFGVAYFSLLYFGSQFGWFGGAPRPFWNAALFGFAIPFLVWNTLMSFVIYLHHTHPRIKWYDNEELWKRSPAQLESSVHVIFPGPVNRVFHWIMEHTAHHLRPSIPLYNLPAAQQTIEAREQGRVIVFHWSIAAHLDVVRRCKLYDFRAQRWMDFNGNYTSEPGGPERLTTVPRKPWFALRRQTGSALKTGDTTPNTRVN